MPLNVKGLDRIYATKFEGASAESQAVIEDVFIELREYVKTCKEGFIPFSSFKSVVDSTYEQSDITQLVLLKNRLLKYEQSGLFADNAQEIDALKNALKNDNLIVLDLSEIPIEWQKDFVDNIISLNIEKNNQEFYLIFNSSVENSDVQLLNKLFVKGLKSGITPVLISSYFFPFIEVLLNYAKNLFLFNPSKNLPNDFSEVFGYVSKLQGQEFIICGEITKNIRVFVSFSPIVIEDVPVVHHQEKELSVPQQEYVFNSQASDDNIVQPQVSSEKNQSFVVDLKQSLSDQATGSFNVSATEEVVNETDSDEEPATEDIMPLSKDSVPAFFREIPLEEPQEAYVQENDDIDLDENDYEQEKVFLQKEENIEDSNKDAFNTSVEDEYDEEFLDLVEEASENEGEYIEFEDEDENFSFETPEEADDSKDFGDNKVQNEIVKDVDELYIMPKEEEAQSASLHKKIPVYSADYSVEKQEFVFDIEEGDAVRHQKYGTGIVKKIISYGNKKLCSIHFDEIGRRLLYPDLAVI